MRGVTGSRDTTSSRTPPFLLTRLMRGVTVNDAIDTPNSAFLLTRLMRGVT